MFKGLFSRSRYSSFADFCRDVARGKIAPKEEQDSPRVISELIALSLCAASSSLHDSLSSSKELESDFQSIDKDFIIFLTASFLISHIRNYIKGEPFKAAQPTHILDLLQTSALQSQSRFVDRFCDIKSLSQRRGEMLTKFNEITFEFLQDMSAHTHEKLISLIKSVGMKNSDILSISNVFLSMEVMTFCATHLSAQLEVIDGISSAAARGEFGVKPPQQKEAYTPSRNVDELENLRILAANGDPIAQWHLGKMYFEGKTVEQDYVAALTLLRASAETGNLNAQGLVGVAYELGLGVPIDFDEAEKWLLRAAKQGSDAAAYFLGKLYMEGKGIDGGPQNAALWMERSAMLGNSGAQGVMAEMCFSGIGISENPKQAYFWALLAARDKNPVRIELTKQYAQKVTLEQKIDIFKKAKSWKPGDPFSV